MKSSVVSYAALVVAVVALGMNTFCKKSDSNIAYLDNQKIVAQADLFRQIDGEERKYVDAMIARRNEDEKMLQEELAQLRKKVEGSAQGPAAFQKEIDEFNKKVVFYNEKYRGQQFLIARAKQIARQQVDPFIQEAFLDLAKKGYQVIIPSQAVHYRDMNLDKTDDYIKILNDKNVVVSFPNPASLIPQEAQNDAAAATAPVAAPAVEEAPAAKQEGTAGAN